MTYEPPQAPFEAKSIISTLGKVARAQNNAADASLFESALAECEYADYDNWNGGTHFYHMVLRVPVAVYANIEMEREAVEKRVYERLAPWGVDEGVYRISKVLIRPDDALSGAERHEVESGPKLWAEGKFRLFISHVSRIKVSAHKLKAALFGYEISGFVAHEDIEPTFGWQQEIERALCGMDALCALITPDFVDSRYCDQEVGFAFGSRKLVVPIRLGADPHGFMAKDQGIPIRHRDPDAIAQQVFKALLVNDKSRARYLDVLVTRLETARHWNEAKKIMSYLEAAPSIPDFLLARIASAPDNNAEVADAFGVPARIKALCEMKSAA